MLSWRLQYNPRQLGDLLTTLHAREMVLIHRVDALWARAPMDDPDASTYFGANIFGTTAHKEADHSPYNDGGFHHNSNYAPWNLNRLPRRELLAFLFHGPSSADDAHGLYKGTR